MMHYSLIKMNVTTGNDPLNRRETQPTKTNEQTDGQTQIVHVPGIHVTLLRNRLIKPGKLSI